MSFMLENNFALIQEIANILADFGEEMDKLTNMQLVPFIEIMKRLGSCSPQTLLRPTNLNSICEGLNDLKMTPIDESQIAVPSNTLERLIALSRETLQKLIDVLIQNAKATSKVSKSNHLTLPENEADKLMAIKMGDIEEAIICYDEDLAKRRNRFLTKNLTK
ncbi:uncharacterized protein LOC135922550 [Gordionus sp. m RMFG-2023]|uniref:uncharacterized protein LOC135922550 n=1 Tax=Gordionus sp. m RMFG-2023 TaxID=3053472 RepID=UPI0031FD76E9